MRGQVAHSLPPYARSLVSNDRGLSVLGVLSLCAPHGCVRKGRWAKIAEGPLSAYRLGVLILLRRLSPSKTFMSANARWLAGALFVREFRFRLSGVPGTLEMHPEVHLGRKVDVNGLFPFPLRVRAGSQVCEGTLASMLCGAHILIRGTRSHNIGS